MPGKLAMTMLANVGCIHGYGEQGRGTRAWAVAGKRGGGGESVACVFEGLRRTAELWDWRESMDVFRWMDDSVVVLVGPTCRLLALEL